jgi:hypothetical protein
MDSINVDFSKILKSFNQIKADDNYPFRDINKINQYLSINRVEKGDTSDENIVDKITKNPNLYHSTNSIKNTNSSMGMLSVGIKSIDRGIEVLSETKEAISSYLDNKASKEETSNIISENLKKYQDIVDSTVYKGQKILDGDLSEQKYYIDNSRYLSLDIDSMDSQNLGHTIFLKSYNDEEFFDSEEYERVKELQSSSDKNLKVVTEDVNTKLGGEYEAYFEVNQRLDTEISQGVTDENFGINGITIGAVEVKDGDIYGTLREAINSVSDQTGVIADVEDNKLSLNSTTGERIAISSSSLSNLQSMGIIDDYEVSKYVVDTTNFNSSNYSDTLEFYDADDNLLASMDNNNVLNISDDSKANFLQDGTKIEITDLSSDITIKAIDNRGEMSDITNVSYLNNSDKTYSLNSQVVDSIEGNETKELISFESGLIGSSSSDSMVFDMSGFSSTFRDKLEFYDSSDNLVASVFKDSIESSSAGLELSLDGTNLTLNSTDSDLVVKLNASNIQDSPKSLSTNSSHTYDIGNINELEFEVSKFGGFDSLGDSISIIDNNTNETIYTLTSSHTDGSEFVASSEDINNLASLGLAISTPDVNSPSSSDNSGTFMLTNIDGNDVDLSIAFNHNGYYRQDSTKIDDNSVVEIKDSSNLNITDFGGYDARDDKRDNISIYATNSDGSVTNELVYSLDSNYLNSDATTYNSEDELTNILSEYGYDIKKDIDQNGNGTLTLLKNENYSSDITLRAIATDRAKYDNVSSTMMDISMSSDTTSLGISWQNSEQAMLIEATLDSSTFGANVSYSDSMQSGQMRLDASKSNDADTTPTIGTLTIAKHSDISIAQERELIETAQLDSSKVDIYRKNLTDISVDSQSEANESLYILKYAIDDLQKYKDKFETSQEEALKHMGSIFSEMVSKNEIQEPLPEEFDKSLVVANFRNFAQSHMIEKSINQLDKLFNTNDAMAKFPATNNNPYDK